MGLFIMIYKLDRFMKISDVPICAQSVGFTASFGTFLDGMIHLDILDRIITIIKGVGY